MEIICGKQTVHIHAGELQEKIRLYQQFCLDIGTGDGRYVIHTARQNPKVFIAGVDACRENLVSASRRPETNSLFIIANALSLPDELSGLASHLTINFPWGSLLNGLLDSDSVLIQSITTTARPGAQIDVKLNHSALAEAGWSLEAGARQVQTTLESAGFRARITHLATADLKSYPSTWARKLAFGRSPHAMMLQGKLV